MAIEADLRQHLINDTDVNNIVDSRIYPLRLPQGFELPAISYQRVSGDRAKDITNGSIGHAQPRIQVDCWTENYGKLKDLAEAVQLALDGFQGKLGGGDYVQHVSMESETESYEDETEILRISLDFVIYHNEKL